MLARNGAIGVLVLAALVGSGVYEVLPSRLPADHAAGIAAIVALAAVQVRQAAAIRALRRQIDGRTAPSGAHEGLEVGALAPDFDLPDLAAAWARERNLTTMLVEHGHEVGDRYRAHGTPSAVLVDGRGRIASPVATGPAAIRQLIADHASTPSDPPTPYPEEPL
jgi:hypothetical protein